MSAYPRSFGEYVLAAPIGRGGMAEIYLALAPTAIGQWRPCVIKRVLPELSQDTAFGDMLIEEAKLCANLRHVTIVSTLALGKVDDQYYICMEYVDGVDLNRVMGWLSKRRTPLPAALAVYIVSQVVTALDVAHRHDTGSGVGIVHRDVSPGNILISGTGEVKLCDFGIAKVVFGDQGAKAVTAAHMGGKFAYMAPEVLQGRPAEPRSDLYAAGVVLWELLSGRRLFKSADPEQTKERVLRGDIPPIQRTDVPELEMLEAVVRRALSPDPERRFADGAAFLSALDDWAHLAGCVVTSRHLGAFLRQEVGDELDALRQERDAAVQRAQQVSPSQETPSERGRFTESLLQDLGEDDAQAPPGDPSARSRDPVSRLPLWAVGLAVAAAAAALAFALWWP